jgi:hypothetical protein
MGLDMSVVAALDDIGKPAWIGLTVLGFWVHWPIGLAILAYLVWSGRMGCWKHARFGRWQRGGADAGNDAAGMWCGGARRAASSGNRAFDEYREETLRRLEEEQREFKEFLSRLRHAKDKEEFDAFMAQHRNRPQPGPDQPSQQQG